MCAVFFKHLIRPNEVISCAGERSLPVSVEGNSFYFILLCPDGRDAVYAERVKCVT